MASTESASPMEDFFKVVSAKDRTNVERHLAAIDAEPDAAHGRLWRRVATTLRKLAPLAVQTVGQHAVQFFVADGKYRMQAFALEDQRDGKILVYLPDVLEEAEKKRVLGASTQTGEAGEAEYAVRGSKGVKLRIDALDANNTPNPAPHYKHMLGWNRKALRLTMLTTAGDAEISAAEALCALAAKRWKTE